ncbi:hypothetical protein ABRQ03_14090 [Pectobacterium jejuense]|uniref:hypothetical protein n=1 Tax=Pectobacterium jejuense TaxID=2974022 RepID=UPI0032ECDD0A
MRREHGAKERSRFTTMCQFMRAERPYCLAHGGNVAAGRHAKTPNVNGGTPSRATRDQPL